MTEPVLTDRLRDQRLLPAAAHLVLLGVVYPLLRDALPARDFAVWAGAIVGIVAVRVLLWARVVRPGVPPHRVAWTVRLTMVSLGLAWGMGLALVGAALPAVTVSLVLLGLAGLLSGGFATLIADQHAFDLYAAAMFLPVMIGLAVWGEGHLDDVGILLVAVFLVFTMRLHAQAHATLAQRVESERQLASAQAIAHVGSWEWDIATQRGTWSDELRRIYGIPSDAPAGFEEFIALAHPDDRARLRRLADESATTGKMADYEWRVVRPDGAIRYIQGRHVMIRDAAGKIIRAAGTALDITDRHRAEENRRTLVLELQKAVAEVKTLEGILPICASCKRIRGENESWQPVELYVREHTNAEFSHGLCPDCVKKDWA